MVVEVEMVVVGKCCEGRLSFLFLPVSFFELNLWPWRYAVIICCYTSMWFHPLARYTRLALGCGWVGGGRAVLGGVSVVLLSW